MLVAILSDIHANLEAFLSVIETVRVPYDFKATSRKIKERGFPEAYAYRLW